MATEITTIARPYAEAVFRRAVETDKLDLWSEMLGLLATAVADEGLAGLLGNPKLTQPQKTGLMLEIGGAQLSDEGQNLVKLLAGNGRLAAIGEIARVFEQRKAEHEGLVDVHVVTAYALEPAQEEQIISALKAKLGREVRITSREDPELIGGFRLTAGDMVIDGSVSNQLNQMAHELGL